MNSRVASDNNGRGPFRAVILDYGAVLCELPFAHEIQRMSEVLGVTVAAFPALYASKRKAYDRGDLTTSEYWNCMALAAKTQLKPENREADALAAGVEVTPENIDSEADAHAAKVALNNENTGGEGDALAAKAQLKPENTDREAYAPAAGVELTPETIRRLARWDMEMWSRINVEMREWVATLRAAGYRTALLSNMQFDMIEHVRANFPWLGDFDHQIFSAELRVVKPDPAIYLHCLEKLGAGPAETIFVDDREENVAAARALGIAAFRFESVAQLRGELEAAGFRHLP